MESRPTFAEIDLAALRYNFQQVRNTIPAGCGILAVVKADAYGHGAVTIGVALEAEGAIAAQQPVRAQRLITRARFLAEKARRSAAFTPADFKQQCETELQQLLADINEVETESKNAGNPEALTLVDLARKAHAEGQRICARANNSLPALAAFRMMVRMGHQFLLQAEALAQDGSPEQVGNNVLPQRLKELDASIVEVRSNVQGEPTGFAQILVTQAASLRDRAHAASQRGYQVVAMETSGMALDLLREALKLNNK